MSVKSIIQRLMGHKPLVAGVDIGHNTVKWVELERVGADFRLKHAEIEPIELTDDHVTEDAIVAAVGRIVSRTGGAGARVVASISGEAVIVRPIPIPIVSEKQDISLIVQGEARDFIPFDPGDVILDYQRLGAGGVSSGGSQEVLVVAAQRGIVSRHLDLMARTGLETAVIDAGSTALMNAMMIGAGVGEGKTVALVNIGSEITNIGIVHNNTARFARDLSVAGRNITKSIMSDLEVPYEQAEALKREHGLNALFGVGVQEAPEPKGDQSMSGSIVDEVYAAIDSLGRDQGESDLGEGIGSKPTPAEMVASLSENVLGDILNEVKRSLLFYENQMDGESVDLVLLSGGASLMPKITDYFEQNLEVTSRLLQPLDRIANDLNDLERIELGAILATGIGLALRCAA